MENERITMFRFKYNKKQCYIEKYLLLINFKFLPFLDSIAIHEVQRRRRPHRRRVLLK